MLRGSPSVHAYPVDVPRGQTDGRIQWRPRVESVGEREGNGKAAAEASADLKRPGDVEEGLPSGSSPLSFHLSWFFPSILSCLLVHLLPVLLDDTAAALRDGDNGCCVFLRSIQ